MQPYYCNWKVNAKSWLATELLSINSLHWCEVLDPLRKFVEKFWSLTMAIGRHERFWLVSAVSAKPWQMSKGWSSLINVNCPTEPSTYYLCLQLTLLIIIIRVLEILSTHVRHFNGRSDVSPVSIFFYAQFSISVNWWTASSWFLERRRRRKTARKTCSWGGRTLSTAGWGTR